MIEFKPKSSRWELRLAGWIMRVIGQADRWSRTWVTVGGAPCYPSETAQNPMAPIYEYIRAHELMHAERQLRWPRFLRWLWLVLYLEGGPLPIFFAWFRYNEERRAFLVNVLRGDMSVEQAVDALATYLWPWPRRLMRAWFDEQFAKKT